VKGVSKKGFVVLNSDDPDVYEMRQLTTARVITFGISEEAQVRGVFPDFIYDKEGKVSGTSFKVDVSGSSVPISITGALGNQHIYPVLASLAVVYGESLNLLRASENFRTHESPQGRMKLIDGISDTVIIDDSYNASPVAMEEGLLTLHRIKNKGRKIAVLGDMLELGKFSHDEHVRLGKVASESSDIVVAVGLRAKDLGEEVSKLKKEVYFFNESNEAGNWLKDFIKSGDVVYVKGSQGMRMERVVEVMMRNPEKKSELLVRQEKEWLNR
jgi:UDP-N-acetylmuramoyl-tripeptide--D-alanyl-D-alanine ligase